VISQLPMPVALTLLESSSCSNLVTRLLQLLLMTFQEIFFGQEKEEKRRERGMSVK
jgi:hypothetical protein